MDVDQQYSGCCGGGYGYYGPAHEIHHATQGNLAAAGEDFEDKVDDSGGYGGSGGGGSHCPDPSMLQQQRMGFGPE